MNPPGRLDVEFIVKSFKGLLATPSANRERVGCEISTAFAGVCIAVPKDTSALERVVELVSELGLRSLRLDFSTAHELDMVDRLVDRVREQGCEVLLHLVQSKEEASSMPDHEGMVAWQNFVQSSLAHFKGRIEAVEVGTTINRAKWAGYSLEGFLGMWKVAHEAAAELEIPLVGPNVTDFEPQYNAGLLAMLKARGYLPQIHSNNLFAERAIEPEATDRKILGERLKGLHGYDVIKKARFIQSIGELYGVSRAWSTCAFWTLPRIKRVLTQPECKKADYLVRYFVLCAASGAFERIYWGPLISRREGLLDDGTGEWSMEGRRDVVAYYRELPGEPTAWRHRPAFYAMQAFNRLLVGARYSGSLVGGPELQIHAFEGRDRITHVCWTMNGKVALPADCYSESGFKGLIAAFDRDGARMERPPSFFGESPCFLEWPVGKAPVVNKNAAVQQRVIVAPVSKGKGYFSYEDADWRGLVYAGDSEEAQLLIDALQPEAIGGKPQQSTLRKARNAIWTIEDPRDSARSLVVKQPERIAWHKRILDCRKPSKALRSWNGTCQLLRRGIESPAPVAYFEAKDSRRMLENWFICENFGGGHSVRSFFTGYASGEEEVEGFSFEDFVHRLVKYIQKIHRRGVYFRDLSGGNVLVQLGEDGYLKFSLIDTARSHFRNKAFPLSKRVDDLKRLVHKLDPARQKYFMNAYLKEEGGRFTFLQNVSFKLYAVKAQLKRWKRRLRKRLSSDKLILNTGKKHLIALFLHLPASLQHILNDAFSFASAG